MLKSSRKGQLEAVGLIFVVILVTLGMLFFIMFSLRSESGVKSTFTRSQLATNFLNSVHETKTGCADLKMRKLIQDCMSPQDPISCSPLGSSGGTVTSCEFVELLITDLLEQTLKEWGKNYQFSIFAIGEPPKLQINHGECLRDKDSHTISIPQESGVGKPISVRIDVC